MTTVSPSRPSDHVLSPIPGDPTRPGQRIAAIDVLRGVVILGILPMNIQLFATVEAAFLNPHAGPWTDAANVALWSLMHVLVGHKDLSIFAMLFGAGIIMIDARSRGRGGTRLHYRRMLVLLAMGMLHAYLLWPGDILVTYALAGMAVYPLRVLRPVWQLTLGLAAYAVPMVICLVFGLILPGAPAGLREPIFAMFAPSAEQIAAHHATYAAGWWSQFPDRAASSLSIQLVIIPLALFWVAGGMMLVGMALYRWGVFFATLRPRIYLLMIALGLTIGLPVVLWGLYRNFQADWAPAYSMFLGRLPSETVQPLMAGAWIAFWMLICRAGALPWLTRPLSAVGRMALSNYLAQTLLCSFLFYGNGLGLIGQIDRFGQLGLAVGFWIVELAVSSIWLKRFQYGPAEWVWRALTYVRPPAMRARSTDSTRVSGDSSSFLQPPADSGSRREALSFVSALGRVAAFAGLLIPLLGIALMAKFAAQVAGESAPEDLALYVVAGASAILVAWVCRRIFEQEQQPATREGRRVAGAGGLAWGALLGLCLPLIWMGAVFLLGWTAINTTAVQHPLLVAIGGAFACLALATFEEVAFRGYAYQTLCQWNRFGAIALCGIGFVGIHLPNPGGMGAAAMVNMFLFHLLLVGLLARAGTLWPLVGLHAAWNFAIGTLLGLSVSGDATDRSLLDARVSANAWTGSAFGPEGGWLITLVLVGACLCVYRLPNQGQGAGSSNGYAGD
ncbi:MAG: DUF418 domain-containing protein [Phycisphaerae bacterium]|nr:DUF418 domain-containing protein [Phycisphaerae bacterium]